MASTIGRRSLRVPDEADSPDPVRDIVNLATDLQNVAIYNRGSALPSAGEYVGDFFKLTTDLTDSPDGTLYEWTGAAWVKSTPLPSYFHLADTYANRPGGPGVAAMPSNGVRFFATDKGMEWQVVAGAWVLVNNLAPEVTAMPTSPIDQQECVLILDAANGVKVRLRYRAASTSAYKWETVGESPPLIGESTLNEGMMTNTAYANVNGSLTLPFGGDWDIEVFSQQMGSDAAQSMALLSYKIGAAAASDVDAVANRAETAGANPFTSVSMRRRKTGITAATLLQIQFRVTAGNGYPTANGGWSHGLRAWPVRLG